MPARHAARDAVFVGPETRSTEHPQQHGRLVELTRLFLKLGAISFGGPAAHIALMRDEVVERRQWLTEQEFLDLLGATNLIPGPNSTEMAIHIGHRRAGMPGLLVAGTCFILPAVAIVSTLAWVYVRFGTMPQARALLAGITAVIIAVIVQAMWALGRAAVKSTWLAALAVLGVIALSQGVNEVLVLAIGGLAAGVAGRVRSRSRNARSIADLLRLSAIAAIVESHTVAAAVSVTGVAVASAVGLGTLFGVFLKAGAVLFGSGYVLIAFLRADLVDRLGWLTEHELWNAIAVGQMTPGPVFTTATFVGYLLAGPVGGLVATAGIFLPAFIYVAISARFVPRLRQSAVLSSMLDGINVMSLALMVVVTWQMARTTLVDPISILVAALSGVLLVATRVNSIWLISAGAAVGLARAWW
jgi:chromate transporter